MKENSDLRMKRQFPPEPENLDIILSEVEVDESVIQ